MTAQLDPSRTQVPEQVPVWNNIVSVSSANLEKRTFGSVNGGCSASRIKESVHDLSREESAQIKSKLIQMTAQDFNKGRNKELDAIDESQKDETTV